MRVIRLTPEIQEITAETIRLASLVRESTGLARRALIQADVPAANVCLESDVRVDELRDRLEDRVLAAISLYQPEGEDLRFLGCTYRSLVDLERAGDYAARIARSGAELATAPPLKKYLDMDRMLEITESMIDKTIVALVEHDDLAARQGRELDEEIDQLYEQVQRELLTYMMEDPGTVSTATKLLAVCRYLERLGDHIENVCDHLLYWLTGKRH